MGTSAERLIGRDGRAETARAVFTFGVARVAARACTGASISLFLVRRRGRSFVVTFFAAHLMAAPARPTVDRAFSRLAIRVSSTAWRCKSPAVGHTINLAVSVVGDEKRAVAEDQQARRPPPHPPALLVRRPAGDEVVVSAAGPAV